MTENLRLLSQFESWHASHHWPDLSQAHLAPDDVLPLLEAFNSPAVKKSVLGYSLEGRPIYHFAIGRGPRHVLAWSQMHGDEPSATASILDLLNTACHLGEFNTLWAEQFTLNLVPMLNPDGAARCSRFTAMGMDLNRDALAVQAPESKLLWKLVSNLKPELALNLHDQSPYYGAGDTGRPCTLSFMAPPADESNTQTPQRQHAMEIIGGWVELLGGSVRDAIGRYDEPYTPESFGDALAAKGVCVVLIESGYAHADPFRQVARKANYLAICLAMTWLSDKSLLTRGVEKYLALPVNREDAFVDLIVRNVSLTNKDDVMVVDIAINVGRQGASIVRIGDVRSFLAFQEYDAQGMSLKTLRYSGESTDTQNQLERLRQGKICKAAKRAPHTWQLPDYLGGASPGASIPVVPGHSPWFLLCDNNKPLVACVDGLLISLKDGKAMALKD